MSGVKGEHSDSSPALFLKTKGEPMRFFIRPGPTKVQLQPLITSGGGVLCRTQEPSAILLADPENISAVVDGVGQFYISAQYIRDCVVQNQQLNIEKYRLSNLQPVKTRSASRKQPSTGRLGYSLEDDKAILDFIEKRQHEAKGNRVWQLMQQQGVTAHSWQSMKDRFLKHLQKHKLTDKSPEKKVLPLKTSSSSEDNISQTSPQKQKVTPRKKKTTPQKEKTTPQKKKTTPQKEKTTPQKEKTTPQKKKTTPQKEKTTPHKKKATPQKKKTTPQKEKDSDLDNTQISPDVQQQTEDTPADPTAPEEASLPQHSESEKNQPQVQSDDVQKDSHCEKPDQEDQCQQDSEQPEISAKRARIDQDVTQEETSVDPGPSNQPTTPKKTPHTATATGRRKLGILERAAREFEDSLMVDGESQEDQPLSRTSSVNSDTDEHQIMAARERAVREKEQNSEHCNGELENIPQSQNSRCIATPAQDAPGPSSAALPVTSNAHMFIFDQESQEDLTQSSQNLLEAKEHIVHLMQECKKDLVDVMKALLKASGDLTLARSYLLDGHNREVHGPLWTKRDDELLLSGDSSELEQLHEKYGKDRVTKRIAYLQ